MSKCDGAANLRGEHIPCREGKGHGGPCMNADHGLIWQSPRRSRDVRVLAEAGTSNCDSKLAHGPHKWEYEGAVWQCPGWDGGP